MVIRRVFSKLQRRSRDEGPEVYQYKTIPTKLRVQVVHILNDAFQIDHYGDSVGEHSTTKDAAYKWAFDEIHKALSEEYGLFNLDDSSNDAAESVLNFLLRTPETDKAIHVIELAFDYIEKYIDRPVPQNNFTVHTERRILPEDAIDKLNRRFRENEVGFQYESGRIFRVDSQLIHAEVVRPALHLLFAPMYKGANEEFLSAHMHFRKGRNKECINDCLKAFESCLKAICSKRGWDYTKKDTAKRLTDIVFEKGLLPEFMEAHFSGLRSALESGVPTVRNRLSGHGQGLREINVPDNVAQYALHLTASNILLLAKANEGMQSNVCTYQDECDGSINGESNRSLN